MALGESQALAEIADIVRQYAAEPFESDALDAVDAMVEIEAILHNAGLLYEGTEGQDRDSYSDDQDRKSYTVTYDALSIGRDRLGL